MDDLNTREYLEKIKEQVFENLRNTGFNAPSVQQQRELAAYIHALGTDLPFQRYRNCRETM